MKLILTVLILICILLSCPFTIYACVMSCFFPGQMICMYIIELRQVPLSFPGYFKLKITYKAIKINYKLPYNYMSLSAGKSFF